MTEIAFHFGAADKLGYTTRLLRKAVASGARVLVLADAHTVSVLDAEVWALLSTDFVAHCTALAGQSMQQRSPLMLATDAGQAPHHRQVLVNLTESVPEGFAQFSRVIEVVGTDDSDREPARRRWRRYTELGYSILRHDLARRGAN